MKLTRLSLPLSDSGASARTPGIHLSGILYQLAIRQGIYSPPKDNLTQIELYSYFQARHMKRICGLAWEDWLANRIVQYYPTFDYHFGELSHENIIGTPDGVSYESDGRLLLHEIKHTRYSSAQLNFPQNKLAPWLWQCMGYLRMLSEETGCQCTRAVLHPLFTDGDYKQNKYPQYLPTLFEFTWDEILANWELVQSVKELAVAEKGQKMGVNGEEMETE